MLALHMYRDSRCPGCGGDLVETTASENEDRYRHQPPLECYRCVAFVRAHDAHADQPHPQALIHLVRTVPRRGVNAGA